MPGQLARGCRCFEGVSGTSGVARSSVAARILGKNRRGLVRVEGEQAEKQGVNGVNQVCVPRLIDFCPERVCTNSAVNRLRSVNRRGNDATAPKERMVQLKDVRSPEPCRKFWSRRSSEVRKTLVKLELAFRSGPPQLRRPFQTPKTPPGRRRDQRTD